VARATKIQFADTLRGVAAIVVMWWHYVGFWINRDDIANISNFPPLPSGEPATPHALVYFASAYPFAAAEFGVALFFLVSGFVIPFSFAGYSRCGFLVARILRLYPTYMIGFGVTLLALAASGWVYGRPFPYAARAVFIHAFPGLRDIAWSPHIDYVVWTLEVEVKFYLVCLLLAPFLRLGRLLVFTAPVAATALCVAFVVWLPTPEAMPALGGNGVIVWRVMWAFMFAAPMIVFMFIGVAIHYLFRGLLSLTTAVGLVALLFALFCAIPTARLYGANFADYAPTSFGAAVAVFGVSAALPARFFTWRVLSWAAAISYPLYVVHAIGGYILLRMLAGAGIHPLICMVLTVAAALATASIIHMLVELPTHKLGRRLARRLTSWQWASRPEARQTELAAAGGTQPS
jgi:peptidoglycan/LPS O-acetylase OafA/YrhL